MTLNQLGYFYQAAVLQHFNQAAEKMNISEPSLSRSISALEDELGVTLFEKRGRNVILTKAGEIFLEHATQILDDVKRAENKMHHLATDGGHIDIAYVSPLAREYIPHTVRNFLSLEQNKNITFNFNQDITSVNIEGLKKGAYDLIFGSYSANEPNIEFVPSYKAGNRRHSPDWASIEPQRGCGSHRFCRLSGAWIQPPLRSWQVHTQFLQRTRDCTKFHLRIPGRKRNCLSGRTGIWDCTCR